MKKMVIMLAAGIFMLSTIPAFSEQTKQEKDECLLASKNCTNVVDDIYHRMHQIEKEIKKGTRVYTPQELNILKQKLKETDDMMKDMMKGGGS